MEYRFRNHSKLFVNRKELGWGSVDLIYLA
jgi:hypothetical protein